MGVGGSMTKRMLSGLLLGLMAGLMLAGAAWGQAANDGAITINGGRNTILMRAPSEPIVPAVRPSANLVEIYSNLGKGSKVYNAISGYGILGVDAGQPWPEWVGCGFRPRLPRVHPQDPIARDRVVHLAALTKVAINLDQIRRRPYCRHNRLRRSPH